MPIAYGYVDPMGKVCSEPRCPHIATRSGKCDKHAAAAQRRKVSQRSDAGRRAQAWLRSARWRKRRGQHLASHPFCECPEHKGQRVRGDDPRFGGVAVVDHVVPHRGDYRQFWHGRLQTLTKWCHDSWAQQKDNEYRRAHGG